ncbi:hydrogenase [Seongchinamella unica]|uniref:Hydrogenase n=1 Tax=Seongchinamella unica TaxID=2547392 RepID=A0A4R5LNP3_9GAMM|nr:cytochrome b/b6 domain-containing protein [Seongchinamella unica]TDG11979.1 hydrogenase [Seongchinamella unica]
MQPLWDLPTRVFHWSLVLCVSLAWWSAEFERYKLHEWVGYTIIVLLLSRLTWGFIGSVHSRFSDFIAGPARVVAYIKGKGSPTPGHNPLGGWSVLVLLSLLLLQAFSGLFNSDDVLFSGPLYYAADQQFRDLMGTIHDVAFNVLLGLVALHVLVVCYHQFGKRDGMITAMIRGSAGDRQGREAPQAPWKALLLAAIMAGLLWLGLEQAPQPQPLW